MLVPAIFYYSPVPPAGTFANQPLPIHKIFNKYEFRGHRAATCSFPNKYNLHSAVSGKTVYLRDFFRTIEAKDDRRKSSYDMQGKGIIKFILISVAIVSVAIFMTTLPTRSVENAAEAYANKVASKLPSDQQPVAKRLAYAQYLDSISDKSILDIPLIGSFTYPQLKSKQIALGLDLKGGMNVVLQVDLSDLLKELSNSSSNPALLKSIDEAAARQKKEQGDFITFFGQAWEKNQGGKMGAIFSLHPALKEKINFDSDNSTVLNVLREKATETVDLTYQSLKERIDELGVVQPNVNLDAARQLILVELPGVSNPKRARSFLQNSAKLEFWDVVNVNDPRIMASLSTVDKKLQARTGTTTSQPDSIKQAKLDSLGNPTGDSLWVVNPDRGANKGPLLSALSLNGGLISGPQGMTMAPAVVGTASRNLTDDISAMFKDTLVAGALPRDIRFMWSSKPLTDAAGKPTDKYELYAIKDASGVGKSPLEGDLIADSYASPDPTTGEMTVYLNMNQEGARIWGDMTTKAAQAGNRQIAIALDGKIISAPTVRQPIMGGNSTISGGFTVQEGQDLAKLLNIGKLPARTEIIQESIIGPSLGAENINKSMLAMGLGFLLVFAFMMAYYAGGGVVAILAVILNVFFILGAMASTGTVLTLPGIAGIVLTIGMAVDANVIIYERIREELRAGKSNSQAIIEGFKHSYSAIIDSNLTSMITAVVLAYFGLGPIKGFAMTFIIGLLSTFFTAVLVGRMMIDWWTAKGKELSVSYPWSANVLVNAKYDWMGKRKIAYVFSAVLIVASLVSFFTRGFELGVDFKGGYSYNIQFDRAVKVNADQIREGMTKVFGSAPVVKAISTENTFNVTTSYLIDDSSKEAVDKVNNALYNGVKGIDANVGSFEKFIDPDQSGTHVTSSSKVGATVADDITRSSFIATIVALLLVFIYILVRFNKWQYSLGAVIALFHDTIITLGMFSMLRGILPFSLEIDQAIIAALLTVIGYSINDTVIVFDRVREYLRFGSKAQTSYELVNGAVNSTLSRTLITSLTTLFTIITLLFFGGASIKGFAFAITFGIAFGTYSSVFVATALTYDLSGGNLSAGSSKESVSEKANVTSA